MKPRESKPHSERPALSLRRTKALVWWVGLVLIGLAPLRLAAQEQTAELPASKNSTGWVCGTVVDETFSLVAEAELNLFSQVEPRTPEVEPVARTTSDAHGAFCLRDLPPGFYQLRVAKAPWHIQPPRPVEVRAGLMNRLAPIELELEPGEPRISYEESFDGMPAGQGRAVMERLLQKGDTASVQELARRLLPKRGPRIDLGRLVLGLDVKPLVEELMRQLDSGYLPPLKTARYVYVVGELADARTRDIATPLLLSKLRDPRRLPPNPYTALAEAGQTGYVSDEAIHALARLAGKDFNWKYGQPPLQNRSAIEAAQNWWRQELEKRESRR